MGRGQTVSTYLSVEMAERLRTFARREERSEAQVISQALGLYLDLPEQCLRALRRIKAEADGSEGLQTAYEAMLRKITRAVLEGEREMLVEQAVAHVTVPDLYRGLHDEDAIMQAAVDLTMER